MAASEGTAGVAWKMCPRDGSAGATWQTSTSVGADVTVLQMAAAPSIISQG